MRSPLVLTFACAVVAAAACSSSPRSPSSGSPAGGGGSSGAASSSGDGASSGGPSGDGGSAFFGDAMARDAAPPPPSFVCTPDPANFDVPGNGCDDDGNGAVDDVVVCDAAADPAAADPKDFARALGLCSFLATPSAPGWGVVAARYEDGFARTTGPNPSQVATLAKFGDVITPRQGSRLAVMSTGYAQEYDRPADLNLGDGLFKVGAGMEQAPVGGLPPGFPLAAAGCPSNDELHDVAGIHLEIKVPKNAQGLAFAFDFWSGEWPDYVCSKFNDGFVAYLQTSRGGANVSFDKNGSPLSVNNGFFDRCTPGTQTGCLGDKLGTSTCPGGEGELAGTGFFQLGAYCNGQTSVAGGATGWLQSRALVTPGETVQLDFIVWDTGDFKFDSSVLLDELVWIPVDVPPPPPAGDTGRPPPIH
jgi:hypothetical protein